LLYAAISSQNGKLRDVLRGINLSSRNEGLDILATAMNAPYAELSMAMRKDRKLLDYGFIELGDSPRDMEDLLSMPALIDSSLNQQYGSIQEFMNNFVEMPTPGTLSSEDYPHLTEDLGYLSRIIKGAVGTQVAGVNILLHGIPGTGKTEFAKMIARELGLSIYEVTSKDKDGDAAGRHERLVSLKLSQRFLSCDGNSLVLLDEAEDIFEHGGASMFGRSSGRKESRSKGADSKAWINKLLETNPVPVIWISNAIEQIDPAALRRFNFILEVRTPPLQVRRSIAAKHLGNLPVSNKFLDGLAEQANLVPALLQNAAKVVKLSGAEGQAEIESIVNRVINLTQEAMGEKTTPTLRTSATDYSLDYLNIESRYSIEKILAALKIKSAGTLCFYGLPGTGKTALAEHIARALGRPLIAKRTSELMSMWVGQTEKQIASMFREAENEKAILFLDEADSFMADRQQANKSWEVTQVNELLQQMERFAGIFICATNLFDTLDAAVLRRFTFKLRFNAMTLEQRRQMFRLEALEGDESLLTESLVNRLQRLGTLTPGDFATVKRQVELFGELHSPDEFMAQLEMEVTLKQKGGQRAIGFIA
jgi:SpoVK/Ycf46/Vps4 family AAA+-type ATPase